MITDVLSGKTDAASSAKQALSGRKDADVSSNGFSDALSDLNGEVSQQQAEDEMPEDDGSSILPGDRIAIEAKPSKPKPIIDIRPEALRRSSDGVGNPVESPKQETAGKSGEQQLTPAERKLRDALEAAAKLIAQKSAEGPEKQTATEHGVGVADKAAEQAEDADLDASMLEADDAKIADMLSLLAGSEGKAGELGAMSPRNIGSPQNKRAKDADDRSPQIDAPEMREAGDSVTRGGTEDPLTMPSAAKEGARETRLFRLGNARGEGQSVDMAVSKDRDERTKVEFRPTSGSGAENITVLDSRRYLGLAPNSNSANLTAMLAGDSEWAAAMHPSSALSNAATQSSTGSVVHTLKLQMNPHDLGSVTAMLRLQGEELNVHLTVETRAAYRQLSDDSSGIVDALRAQGFAVDQVTVSIAPTSSSDAAAGQQGQTNQTGQQAMAEGGRQGNAAGRGQEQMGNRPTSDQGARNGNDAASDTAAGAASGGAHPGQLYL